LLPATSYGWSALKAVSQDRWRFVEAPRPELYDLAADPQERRNLASERPADVARLRALLERLDRAAPERGAQAVARDAEVEEALRSLGYLSGASTPSTPSLGGPSRSGGIDPKDGIALLEEFERAKAALREGRSAEAMARLEDLVRRNPGNVPFLSRLAEAQAASGQREAAVATLREAVHWNPTQDLLRVHLADAYLELSRLAEARAEYETTLALNPHAARAWMGLGEVALRLGRPQEELALMRRALAAGVESALVLSRLAQIEAGRGELAGAEEHAREATRLLPEFALGWWVWGESAERRGQPDEAAKRYTRAVEQGLSTAPALLHLGQLLQRSGRTAEARAYLVRAARAGGAAGTEARRLLESRP
jgi:choline-sulfatase